MKPNEITRKYTIALLIIDMFNTFDFPNGDKLLKQAVPVARNILKFKKRLKKKNVAVIYLNDNFGEWRSDSNKVYARVSGEESPGKQIAHLLKPDEDDYFILKPRHSGFFSTNLEIFLSDLGVKKLILSGVAGNICVLFTANDAHMRNIKMWVPADCIASNSRKENSNALALMRDVMNVKISPSSTEIKTFLGKSTK